MKKYQQITSCIILLLISLCSYAQQDWNAAGVWAGKLYNDSTKKFISFEIAISYHNGKYAGYTYTVFVIDSTENIGVKEVTIKDKNDLFIIKDKKLIDDNYKDAPAKGVYTTLELQHTENDTADILSGRWFTNKTREYYPLTGTVSVTKRKNIFATRIVPKLRKLGLADDLSFFSYSYNVENTTKKEEKNPVEKKEAKDSMMTIVEPELVISIPTSKSKELKLPNANALKGAVDVASKNSGIKTNVKLANNNPDKPIVAPKPIVQPKQESVIVVQKPTKDTAINKSVTIKKVFEEQHPTNNSSNVQIKEPTSNFSKSVEVVIPKTESNPVSEKTSIVYEKITQKKDTLATSVSTVNKPIQKIPIKIDLSNRKIETIRTVPVEGDSLVLSLFDNGAVDGDTVSVLLNGQVVVSKVGLLEKAFNQTIHLTPDMGDSIKIVLYAENLGSIPPNTGLLVVRNGGHDYEIRFSGDLTKNSAIILLRNRKL